jgi:hypothetical protein
MRVSASNRLAVTVPLGTPVPVSTERGTGPSPPEAETKSGR